MPQTRTYEITVYPAWIGSLGYMTEPFGPKAEFTVGAPSFDALDAAIDRHLSTLTLPLANPPIGDDRNGRQGVKVYVSVPRGDRKPAGFDRRYRGVGAQPRPAGMTVPEMVDAAAD